MYRLLVVDDELSEREGLTYLVAAFNLPFAVISTSNGREALGTLENMAFDCLITDIKMPFMDGLRLCEEVQRRNPNMIKIIYSAYSDFKFMQKAIQLKVDDFLLKPIVPNEFLTTMHNVTQTLAQVHGGQPVVRQDTQYNEYKDIDTNRNIIGQVTQYINSHYQGDINLDSIAQQVYLSPGYLSSLFKSETNLNIKQYITWLRMTKAKDLLLHSNLPINKIGQEVGYNSLSYFCLMFKKHFGITAQQMREGTAYGVDA